MFSIVVIFQLKQSNVIDDDRDQQELSKNDFRFRIMF